jgi:hypothetical protein
MQELIRDMTDEHLDKIRDSLIKALAEKLENRMDESGRYQRLLSAFSTEFDLCKSSPMASLGPHRIHTRSAVVCTHP